MARANIKIDTTTNTVTITMPLTPRLSKTGKMILLTDTGGNQETETQYEHEGVTKPVYANINIGIYATPKG